MVELEARIRAAQLSADVVALNALIAEDLLFTGPDGRLATKTDDIEAHRTGAVRFLAHEPEELRIRRVGDDVAMYLCGTVLRRHGRRRPQTSDTMPKVTIQRCVY